MPLPRARIVPSLLLLSAAAGIAAAFAPWLQIDTYETTSADGVFHWQSSTPLSPRPDFFHGHNRPFVLGYPPSSGSLALVLFAPPVLTILLALAAWRPARPGTVG